MLGLRSKLSCLFLEQSLLFLFSGLETLLSAPSSFSWKDSTFSSDEAFRFLMLRRVEILGEGSLGDLDLRRHCCCFFWSDFENTRQNEGTYQPVRDFRIRKDEDEQKRKKKFDRGVWSEVLTLNTFDSIVCIITCISLVRPPALRILSWFLRLEELISWQNSKRDKKRRSIYN